VAASGEGYCPALITIGDRKAHEDSCAYRPAVLQSDEATGGAAGQLMNRLQFPQVQVNVDQVMQALRTNLTRFERVLADRMDVLLAQVRSLIEEQNIHRLRSGASGAMANFKCAPLGLLGSLKCVWEMTTDARSSTSGKRWRRPLPG
jgi:hypothetical protein